MMKYKNIILYFTIIIITLLESWSIGEVLLDLRGPAFSDPEKQIDMSDAWKQQPVIYEKWAENADLAITLDQHMYPALLPLINRYASENNLKIAVNEGTCGISSGLLIRKAVDIAGFCCPPAEADRFPDLKYHTVGIGALAIFVHPENPVNNVTFQQAQRIFQGKIQRWSELKTTKGGPGPDVPIETAARLHCKFRPGHWQLLLGGEDLFSARLKSVGSIEDVMFEAYNNRDTAAGLESLYMAHYRYAKDVKLKPLKINGFDPSEPEHLLSGDYRIYYTYNLAVWTRDDIKKTLAAGLIDYLLKHTHEVEPKFGIVPSSSLRNAGWIFKGDELVGEPTAGKIRSR